MRVHLPDRACSLAAAAAILCLSQAVARTSDRTTASRGAAARASAAHAHIAHAADEPSAREIRDRAAAYVRSYDQRLTAIVGDELYQQQGDEYTGARSTGREERTLKASIAWVHLASRDDTIAVREVTEVDGQVVQKSSRIQQLCEGPDEQLEAKARVLLDESAAHNLAPGSRNINLPTFPLVYLRPPYVDRSRWRLRGRDGTRVLLDFEERGRPTAVRSESGDNLQGRGRFWVDETSGRIERIELRLAGRKAVPAGAGERAWTDISYRGEITFSPDGRLGLWLPATMTDAYVRFSGTHRLSIQGHATYSNYRRFETGARVIGVRP